MSEQSAPGPVPGASARPEVVDLDAMRAQRLEALGERWVRLFGRDWHLVPEVPFEFAEAWALRRRTRCAALILVDPGDVQPFMDAQPSNEDFDLILEQYKTTPGKSSAS